MPRTSHTPRATAGRKIQVTPFAPALGGEVRGIDLADGLDEETYQEVRAAFLQHHDALAARDRKTEDDRR